MDNKILIIHDEDSICEILKYNFELEGYSVTVSPSAVAAMQLDIPSYSLIILDIMMKDMDGYEFAMRLKGDPATEFMPIIFCSALSSEDARVKGLNIGGDDYIVKPFRIREVLARVRSLLRRTQMVKNLEAQNNNNADENEIHFRELCISKKNKLCIIKGEPVRLTKTELELLVFFLSTPNCIYTR